MILRCISEKVIGINKETTDWGVIRKYNGDGFEFCLYRYNDDLHRMYLSNVEVQPSSRRQGKGNLILQTAEKESLSFGAESILLRVIKDSWMHDWYHRHGYNDVSEDPGTNLFWMEKELITKTAL